MRETQREIECVCVCVCVCVCAAKRLHKATPSSAQVIKIF